ncbi:hypothetical protein [Iningainema tapete]|uniref:Uncharacterized protein n=1 Tax=Iningainema tapete BLCC-T55 TaxID=2748662 RepID=A0A8J6XAG7_9CYAN|nr:hypothetical protein [Iningainema tapete]MBD2771200.1 hypothetical protein [Iningainema tapete BLCC-T55]
MPELPDLPNSFLGISDAMPFMVQLGYGNVEHIRYAIRKNFFRLGIEVIDARMPQSNRPTYRVNPHLCSLRLHESPAKRNTRKRGRPPKAA